MDTEKEPDYPGLIEALDRIRRRHWKETAQFVAFLLEMGILQAPNALAKNAQRAGRRRARTARRGPHGEFVANGEDHENDQTEDAGN